MIPINVLSTASRSPPLHPAVVALGRQQPKMPRSGALDAASMLARDLDALGLFTAGTDRRIYAFAAAPLSGTELKIDLANPSAGCSVANLPDGAGQGYDHRADAGISNMVDPCFIDSGLIVDDITCYTFLSFWNSSSGFDWSSAEDGQRVVNGGFLTHAPMTASGRQRGRSGINQYLARRVDTALGLCGHVRDGSIFRNVVGGVCEDIADWPAGVAPTAPLQLGKTPGLSPSIKFERAGSIWIKGFALSADGVKAAHSAFTRWLARLGTLTPQDDGSPLGQILWTHDDIDRVLPLGCHVFRAGNPDTGKPGYQLNPASHCHGSFSKAAALSYIGSRQFICYHIWYNRRDLSNKKPNGIEGNIAVGGVQTGALYNSDSIAFAAYMAKQEWFCGGNAASVRAVMAANGDDPGPDIDVPGARVLTYGYARDHAADVFTVLRGGTEWCCVDVVILPEVRRADIPDDLGRILNVDFEAQDGTDPETLLARVTIMAAHAVSQGILLRIGNNPLQRGAITTGFAPSVTRQIALLPGVFSITIAAVPNPADGDVIAYLDGEAAQVTGPNFDEPVPWNKITLNVSVGPLARNRDGELIATQISDWAVAHNVAGWSLLAAIVPHWDDPAIQRIVGCLLGLIRAGDADPLPPPPETDETLVRFDDGGDADGAVAGVTCVRPGKGWASGPDRIVYEYSAHKLRFAYDLDGFCLGALVEEGRTELEHENTALDSATSFASSQLAGVTANAAAGPDDATSAELVIPNATMGTHFRRKLGNTAISYVAGQTYAVSAFFSAGDWPFIGMTESSSAFGSPTPRAYFDLTAGTLYATQGWGSTFISQYANDFWRIQGVAVATTTIDLTSATWTIADQGYPSNNSPNFSGDGVKGQLHWGYSLQVGKLPLSPIVNTGTTDLTRPPDLVGYTGTPFLAGKWFAAAGRTAVLAVQEAVLFQLDDGTASNRVTVRRLTDSHMHVIWTAAGVDQADIDLGAVDNAADISVMFGYDVATDTYAAVLCTAYDQASGLFGTIGGLQVFTPVVGSTYPIGLAVRRGGRNSSDDKFWNGALRWVQARPDGETTATMMANAVQGMWT